MVYNSDCDRGESVGVSVDKTIQSYKESSNVICQFCKADSH